MSKRYKQALLLTTLIYSLVVLFYSAITSKTTHSNSLGDKVVNIALFSQTKLTPQTQIIKKEITPQKKIIEDKTSPLTVDKKPQTTAVAIQKKDTNSTQKRVIDTNMLRADFESDIYSKIKKNKTYPQEALDNHIEGEIKATLTLEANGTVSNITINNGNNLLKAATREAIEKSIPFKVPQELTSQAPMVLDITLSYRISK